MPDGSEIEFTAPTALRHAALERADLVTLWPEETGEAGEVAHG